MLTRGMKCQNSLENILASNVEDFPGYTLCHDAAKRCSTRTSNAASTLTFQSLFSGMRSTLVPSFVMMYISTASPCHRAPVRQLHPALIPARRP